MSRIDLKPIEPLTKKLDEFKAFRGAKVTPYMQKYLAVEQSRLVDMVKQVKKHVAAGLSKIQEARETLLRREARLLHRLRG